MKRILFLIAFMFSCVTTAAAPWQFIRDEGVILDLLRNGEMNLSPDVAKALSEKEGILKIRRVGLQKGSLQIRAAFRDAVINMHHTGQKGQYFDAYYNELAAYIVAKYLGLNFVPMTVLRELPITESGLKKSKKLRQGTLQLWIENTIGGKEYLAQKLALPGDPVVRKFQLNEIEAFDCLIGNSDRHVGNILIDLNERFEELPPSAGESPGFPGKVWAIDHSRSFPSHRYIKSKRCKLENLNEQPVSLAFMQNLRTWKIEEIESALTEGGLSNKQLRRLNLKSLDSRARKLREHIESRQAISKLSDEHFYSSGIWHKVL